MGEENRPNLNAIGLMVAIHEGLEKYVRGNAGKAGMEKVVPLLSNDIQRFIEVVDEKLDREFGR